MWRARLFVRAAQSTLVVALAVMSGVAHADASSQDRLERAAATFDAGVKAFERGEYEIAARQFLHADELVPDADTLYNAIMAAERAKHDGLIATAAERAASRAGSKDGLAARGQKTLMGVRPRVVRLVLTCEPSPCELAVDGEHAAAGASYALPGALLVTARWADGSLAERSLDATSGSEHSITLARESRAKTGVAAKPFQPSEPRLVASSRWTAEQRDDARPLSPPVVYAGIGVTLALAAATTWSGLDTLNAKNRLPGTQSDNDAVMARAHRTDALLIGTVAAGVATATIGLVWTDWSGEGSEVALGGSFGERAAFLNLSASH